eukprot:scaffold408608_cov47-Attheya_sp.AAC.3
MVWLANGPLPANSCNQRWGGCGGDPSACCDGATCRPNIVGVIRCSVLLADNDDPAISNPTTPTTTGPTPQPVTPAPVTPTES